MQHVLLRRQERWQHCAMLTELLPTQELRALNLHPVFEEAFMRSAEVGEGNIERHHSTIGIVVC